MERHCLSQWDDGAYVARRDVGYGRARFGFDGYAVQAADPIL